MKPTPDYPFEGVCGDCRQLSIVREISVTIGKERFVELVCPRCDEDRKREEEARRLKESA